eukprot:gb/GEZN01005726.1/.p1 GENE.gb/GEZN01005726.1/~~gb/GEZN01005726.1/.p1  ORF type:complete len:574 (-),score=67.06 gb/GEZN01005726.1/:41-1693(-)
MSSERNKKAGKKSRAKTGSRDHLNLLVARSTNQSHNNNSETPEDTEGNGRDGPSEEELQGEQQQRIMTQRQQKHSPFVDSCLHAAPESVQLYLELCDMYHRISNPGVVISLRYRTAKLMPATEPTFSAADLLPLADLFLMRPHLVVHVTCLDFSRSKVRSHGAVVLAQLLRHGASTVTHLHLDGNMIGPHGAKVLAEVFLDGANTTLTELKLKGNQIRGAGALAWADALGRCATPTETTIISPAKRDQLRVAEGNSEGANANSNGSVKKRAKKKALNAPNGKSRGKEQVSATSQEVTRLGERCCCLAEVDFSMNMIGWHGVDALKEVERKLGGTVRLNTDDNLVFPEVMNSLTHGLGFLFCFVGSWYMLKKTLQGEGRPLEFWSCLVYCFTLILLYFSSTFYHIFFMTRNIRYVFGVLDHCAIYLLIAGSYTPILCILLGDKTYVIWLLVMLWVCCMLGILVAAMSEKGHEKLSLALYLMMGWSCLFCGSDIVARLPSHGLQLLLGGGLAYTGGVPFFVADKYLFHAIWHVFVLAGSIFHYFTVYFYVLT